MNDKVTGFTGTVTGRVEYLTGCRQYLVQPRVGEKGKYPDAHWFDEDRLEADTLVEPMVLTVERPGFGDSAPVK